VGPDELRRRDPVQGSGVHPAGPEGEEGEPDLVREGEVGVPEDLPRGGEGVDLPLDVVAGGPPEPLQPVLNPEILQEREEMRIAGEEVVIESFHPVVVPVVGGQAPPGSIPLLQHNDVVTLRQAQGGNKPCETTPDHADAHSPSYTLIGESP
jgi:hypothetical protein